jgi:hypothetical protein
MKLTEGIPKWTGRIFKAIIYGLALIIILTLVFFFASSRLAGNVEKCEAETGIRNNNQKSALQNTQALVACLQKENSFLENWLLRDTIRSIQSLPNAPCKYVGVWESVRPQCRYTITLKENSEFKGTPIVCNLSMSTYSGTWGVYENKMVWLDSREFRWPIDINPIEAEDKNSFSLLEVNGTHTKFTRVEEASQATGCAQPAARILVATVTAVPVVQPIIAPAPVAVTQLAAAASSVAAIEPVKPVAVQVTPAVETINPVHNVKKARHPMRKPTDLRYCLELSGNYEIAKCATEHK